MVERYEIGARLWHFGVLGLLLALWIPAPRSTLRDRPPGAPAVWLFVHRVRRPVHARYRGACRQAGLVDLRRCCSIDATGMS